MLLPSPLTNLPSTNEAIRAYLADVGGLQVPVQPTFYMTETLRNISMKQFLAPTDHTSLLPAKFSNLLANRPEDHGSELTTTVCVSSFFDAVFPSLNTFSNLELVYKLNLNKSEAGTSSRILKLRTRPDTSLVANSCLLLGEQKFACMC